MHHTLSRLTAQVIEPLDLSDDRLSHLLQQLSKPAYWHQSERDLNARSIEVHALPQDVIRCDATTVSGDHQVTAGCVWQFGFFFSSRRRHTRCSRDWSSDVCSSDLHFRGEHFSRPKYNLPINIADNETNFEVYVYALGYAKENIKVSVHDDVLYISGDRKSTRLNSSHGYISYAVFCLKKKKQQSSQY